MSESRAHMRRALRLAARGRGATSPNPMVGAVIVRDGEVVGEGWHHAVGRAHAEVEALRVAGDKARGATVYVTLEPCCHQGRTGPCSRALVEAGVARVVVAMRDPNPLVAGKGIEELRAAGVEVEVGLLEEESRRLNVGYVSLVTRGRPHVTLKLAATLDGKIASPSGDSRWVSGPASRGLVHRMRGEHDAVAVGGGTAQVDDPQLTARTPGGALRRRQPRRVVFDGDLSLPPVARLLAEPGGGPVFVVGSVTADAERERRLTAAGARVLRVPAAPESEHGGRGGVDLAEAARALGREGIASVLVEGGSRLGTALLRAGLVDELVLFVAPKILGGAASLPMFGWLGLELMRDALPVDDMKVRRVGADILISGTPRHPDAAGDEE